MLFFFAGYEIDFERIKGRSLELAVIGWGLSLVLAYGIGGLLEAAGIVLSLLYSGSATATTAIGTLIPILKDRGEMRTVFGTYLLGAGAVGEFGPILLVTLILSTTHPLREAVILLAFVALAVLLALVAVRSMFKGWPLLERTFETSSQLAVRFAVVLVFGLVAWRASSASTCCWWVRGWPHHPPGAPGREVTVFESKLTAIGYGFFIPFFFITSG
jgi:Kef-type K+ transport system membrane component KefB